MSERPSIPPRHESVLEEVNYDLEVWYDYDEETGVECVLCKASTVRTLRAEYLKVCDQRDALFKAAFDSFRYMDESDQIELYDAVMKVVSEEGM